MFDYLMGFVAVGFIVWFVGPTLVDLFGYNAKKNLDVYESYCNLSLRRKYDKHQNWL